MSLSIIFLGDFMNKKQLIDNISKYTKLQRATCTQVINGLIDILTQCMRRGETLTIASFGKFYPYYINHTIRINPHTKLPFLSSARYTVKFKISPTFLLKFQKTP